MSLAETETLFAGVHETELNDLLTTFFQGRKRLLKYAITSGVIQVNPDGFSIDR
jgi:hypothetical protein